MGFPGFIVAPPFKETGVFPQKTTQISPKSQWKGILGLFKKIWLVKVFGHGISRKINFKSKTAKADYNRSQGHAWCGGFILWGFSGFFFGKF